MSDSASHYNQGELTSTIHLNPASSHSQSEELPSSIEHLSPEERDVLSALPEGSAMLIALSGPAKGSRYLLNIGSTLIGRDSKSDILLDDITVSRKHAQIEHAIGSMYVLKDLGSLNGTYLNGEATQGSTLSQGDIIQLGKFKLTFFVKGGSQ